MYGIIAPLSIFIRNFILPNPFEAYPLGLAYNWLAEIILYPITFITVGLFYEKGSNPALGSLLYLVFYLIYTGLLMLCSLLNFSIIACVVIIVVYLAALISLVRLQNGFGRRYY